MKCAVLKSEQMFEEVYNSKKLFIRQNKFSKMNNVDYGEKIVVMFKDRKLIYLVDHIRHFIFDNKDRVCINDEKNYKMKKIRNGFVEITLKEVSRKG